MSEFITQYPLMTRPVHEQRGLMSQSRVCSVPSSAENLEANPNVTPVYIAPGHLAIRYPVNAEHREGDDQWSATISLAMISDKAVVKGNTLKCHMCSYKGNMVAWCPHISWAVRRQYDMGLFSDIALKEFSILIPLVPSTGIFLPIRIERDDSNMNQVIVVTRDDGAETPALFTIGYTLQPTMVALRAMLIDWLEGWLHEKRFFQVDDFCSDGHAGHFADRVMMGLTGRCTSCLQGQNESAEPDYSADAPDF